MPDRSLEFTPVDIEAAVANAMTMFAWGEPRQCPNAECRSDPENAGTEQKLAEVQPRSEKASCPSHVNHNCLASCVHEGHH